MAGDKTEAKNASSMRVKGRPSMIGRRTEKNIRTNTLRARLATGMAKGSARGAVKGSAPGEEKHSDPRPKKVSVQGAAERGTAKLGNYLQLIREQLTKESQSYAIASNTDDSDIKDPATAAIISQRVLNAIQRKKVFSLRGYYPIISEELKKRGWIEKRDPECKPLEYEYLISLMSISSYRGTINIKSPPLLSPTTVETLVSDNLANKHIAWPAIRDVVPNYVFTTKTNNAGWTAIDGTTTISQLAHLTFCNKAGMTETVARVSKERNVKFPRAYIISNRRSLDVFVKDYRLTAVLGSLKYILRFKHSREMIFKENGTIPYEMIDFIEQRCWEFINAYQSVGKRDILWFTTELEKCWNKFIAWSHELVEQVSVISLFNSFQMDDIYERFDGMAQTIKSFCPQCFIDGETNLWILKPSNSSSGVGIQLERRLENMTRFLTGPNATRKIYIIQKYIETPLRIFSVKVDLRQYFLITNTRPMKIWMYKEGYVKFCSKPFSVDDLSDAVHVSNVQVQSSYRKYKTPGVPEECMWDFAQFKRYLASIGKGGEWRTSIYPSICETITVVVRDHRKWNIDKTSSSSFQLLGADFVLTENLDPWLIEINGNPGLSPTTSVIANVAATLLEDMIKVTVDFPLNSTADTGLFENIYTDTFIKRSDSAKTNTKEYYYHQPPKTTTARQLRNKATKVLKK